MAGAKPALSFAQRAAKRQAEIEAALRRDIKAALPAAKADAGAVLKALRALGRLQLGPAARRQLRDKLVVSLAKAFQDINGIKPKDLGARDLNHLAEIYVTMLERARYAQYGTRELRQKRRGLRGIFAGELFEQLVLNLEPLQKDLVAMAKGRLTRLTKQEVAQSSLTSGLQRMAEGQLEGMNQAIKQSPKHLVDARGTAVALKGKFEGIYRATDIFIHKGGKKLKFVDLAFVTYMESEGVPYVSFLVETEIKLPRAAAEFADQIDAAQGRFGSAELLEMVVADEKGKSHSLAILPEQVVFDVTSINRTAVTTTTASQSTYRFRTTEREAFLRVGLSVNTDALYRLVNVLFNH